MRMLDLFAGRLGWSKAFLARGWEVVAVDLVEPAEIPQGVRFVKGDVLMMYYDRFCGFCFGSQFSECLGHFDFACASSPCEKFSVFAMPHFHPNPPYPEEGIKLFEKTRSLFETARMPYVMENVRAAQKFVGRADHHCGPYYLWGNVPTLVPQGIKKGFQTGGAIIQRLKRIDRQALTDYRRLNDGSWSSSKSAKRKEWTAKVAEIPPELASCVADYAERICEQHSNIGSLGCESGNH